MALRLAASRNTLSDASLKTLHRLLTKNPGDVAFVPDPDSSLLPFDVLVVCDDQSPHEPSNALLLALARGLPVVSPCWLDRAVSASSAARVDHWRYLHPCWESLCALYAALSARPFRAAPSVAVTLPAAHPLRGLVASLVCDAGGVVASSVEEAGVVVGGAGGWSCAAVAAAAPPVVVHPQWVLDCVAAAALLPVADYVQQRDYAQHQRLSTKRVASQVPQRSGSGDSSGSYESYDSSASAGSCWDGSSQEAACFAFLDPSAAFSAKRARHL
eukprot:Rhum_TRINITY_DN14533_c7_g1::Rhum_TRINITY_DN14533_c7_g1_i1::g.99036::m.99036